ncbi:MAG TPA: tRNA preQ1(34) S-adenosylmethionine ribosyltransferase-isomerase QueA [Desulfovibrio sp.]|nr:tRNA preQ1(34) S-adenosylmethionine ribosyltransferase-isomerase QueA [Desulfovibrio sp.]
MNDKNLFLLNSYDYVLPEERIAQCPASERQNSRLLFLERKTGKYADHTFKDIVQLLPDNALIIANNSKVIPARLQGHRKSGSKIELLFLEPAPLIDRKARKNGEYRIARTEVLLKGAKRVKPGETLDFPEMELTALEKRDFGKHIVSITYKDSLVPLLKKYGDLPLPPYIKREHGSEQEDFTRYQTVYAKEKNIGSVAAPTAGLHFTEEIRRDLLKKGCSWQELTLHVGYGTFSPVRADDIREHVMHSEYVEISAETAQAINNAKKKGCPVIAVGTTSTRSLEGMAQAFSEAKLGQNNAFFCSNSEELNENSLFPSHGCFGHTDIFLYPGKEFHIVDGLITNFHLPKSSLIMLVSAFAGYEHVMQAYRHAIEAKYRFFSYGDAMLIV